MIKIKAIPCQHIADFYAHKQKNQPCIGNNLLRRGYAQCSVGVIEQGFNNLFHRPILQLKVNDHGQNNQH